MFEQLQRLLDAGKSYDEAITEMAAPKRKWIEGLLRQQPFRPFRLSLTSGHEDEVRNPELVRLTDSTVSLLAPDPSQEGGLRERVMIALIHVVSITVMPPDADQPVIVVDQKSEALKKDAVDARE